MDNGLSQPHFHSTASFLLNDNLFKNDPTLGTLRAFLSLNKSTNTVYEKYVKCKKALSTTFLWDFFSFFRAIHLAWMQKLKQSMITIKVMTENRAQKLKQSLITIKVMTENRAYYGLRRFYTRRNVSEMSRQHRFFLLLHMRKSFVY